MWRTRRCPGLLAGLSLIGAMLVTVAPTPAQAATTLPDGRAYEWVTPTLSGAVVSATTSVNNVAASGNGVTLVTQDAPAGSEGSSWVNPVVATRTPSGWQDDPLSPPLVVPRAGFFSTEQLISADQSQAAFVTDQPLVTGAPAGENVYLRNADGTYTLLTDAADDTVAFPGLTLLPEPVLAGASADFTHIFFNPLVPQLSQDPVTGGGNLYQWAHGQLSIVNVLPDGTDGTEAASLAAGVLPGISANGDDVLFQDSGDSALYLRIDGASTVQVDASQRTIPSNDNNSPAAEPVGITSDGSNVLFTDPGELTNNANMGSTGYGNDLYDYNVNTNVLTDVTPDPNIADPNGADVLSVEAVSPDGSYVYFTAQGELAPGATLGQTNLYVEHDGNVSYITNGGLLAPFNEFYVTPSGQDAVFAATGNLTGYNATDAVSGDQDAEVYEYNAATGTLTCDSCRPDGSQPTGSASIPNVAIPVASDDGQRVFFQSTDSVLPAASNGLQSVFEWEADGTGSCTQTAGCVFLISPGDGGSPATLFGTDPSGDDVFFASYDDLVPQDQTHQSALFDARVGGGFPMSVSAPPCDSSGTCQGPVAAPLPVPTAGTVTFTGPGNGQAPTRVAAVTVSRRSLRGSSFVVNVKVPASGRITITGSEISQAVFRPRRAGTFASTLRLTARARALLRRDHTLRATVRVAYTPTSGTASTASLTVQLLAGVAITHAAAKGDAVVVSVLAPAQGRATLSGPGVRTFTREVSRAGTYRLTVMLTAAARRTLSTKRRLRLTLQLTYRAFSSGVSAASASVELRD